MAEEQKLGDGFTSLEASGKGYKVNGEYPFISELKSPDHAFEISLENSTPPCTKINITLIASPSVESVLNFSVEETAETIIHRLEAIKSVTGLLALGGGNSDDNENSNLQIMSAPSATSLLVSEADGTVHFLTAPPGTTVFGVSKHEYEPGKFVGEWCWYSITDAEDICSETE